MQEFKDVMGLFPTGVSVVSTVDAEGEAYGVTVNSIVSVSLNPPLILFCLDNQVSGLRHFDLNQDVLVSFLGFEQKDVSDFFATPGTERSWKSPYFRRHSEFNLPALERSFSELKGKVVKTYPGGDHTILLIKIESVRQGALVLSKRGPLVYFKRDYRSLDR
jgi:flavin reductase (DIM6/NTAB) family NADH-FMN oxidoreductase RutF